MSSSIDDAVTRAIKDFLQLPMADCVKKSKDFMQKLFEDAEASKWTVPSSEPEMGGKSYNYDVRPNAQRPYDDVDVAYALRFDGTARRVFVTQTLTK